MKKRYATFTTFIIILFGFWVGPSILNLPVWADNLPYSGVVLKVDADQQQFFVRNPATGGRIKFTVTSKTVITDENRKRTLGDLKPGDFVELEYSQEGDQYVAQKVTLKSSGGEP